MRNEYLTLILGIFGCLAFLLVVTSRRDELANLCDDFQDRLTRRRQERKAAKLTWEAIQRIELVPDRDVRLRDRRAGRLRPRLRAGPDRMRADAARGRPSDGTEPPVDDEPLSRPSAVFRLSGGRGPWITLSLGLGAEEPLAADIVFRYMQRLGQALGERLERFEDAEPGEVRPDPRPAADRRADRPANASARTTVGALVERGLAGIGLILGRPIARLAARAAGLATASRHARRPTPSTARHSPARR